MSRTNIFIILGVGLALLLATIGGAALLVRSFLMIDDATTVIATPIAVVEPLLTPTDTIITPTGEATPDTAVTPTPTAEASPTAGGAATCTNAALFVSDVTIPDNSQVAQMAISSKRGGSKTTAPAPGTAVTISSTPAARLLTPPCGR
jgi:hypothetical protein